MQIHELKSKTKRKTSQSVGRGGKRGKTSGRGTKGQKARAGHKIRPEIRDVIKRLPKLRGRGANIFKTIQTPKQSITFSILEKKCKAGDVVSPQTLVKHGLARKVGGKFPPVKILATGTLTKALTFKDCDVSKGAREMIEKAGGKVE